MRTPTRTPQQRDRRFARARRWTQTVFVGAGAVSAVLVGYVAANAKPLTTTSVTTPPVTTTTAPSASTKSSSTSSATVPTTAPVTTTTVCTTTPSGTVTCY
jgi:phosphoribosylcarboxyaminoimidazole (NCAIR) mutase